MLKIMSLGGCFESTENLSSSWTIPKNNLDSKKTNNHWTWEEKD